MMRTPVIWLLLLLSSLFSCQKIELPDDNTSDNPGSEPTQPQLPSDEGEALSVAEALVADVGWEVLVRGYIVGYVDGTAFNEKTAVFAVADEKPNTNMLLADTPYETDYRRCLPVQLTTTGENNREALNLYDHPELLGQAILIFGELQTYFKVNGIKGNFSYDWAEEEPIVTPPEEEEEPSDGEDNPDMPEVPSSPDEELPDSPEEPEVPPVEDDGHTPDVNPDVPVGGEGR